MGLPEIEASPAVALLGPKTWLDTISESIHGF